MTLNQIIGNKEKTSKIDTELWKKMNEKYSGIENTNEEKNTIKNNSEKKLTYENDVPKLELKILENTVVYTPTQKEYDYLIQVYDAGDWNWNNGLQKIIQSENIRINNETEWCIEAGKSYVEQIEKRVRRGSRLACLENDLKIISTREFYDIQKITPEDIEELNEYYNKNYPNRPSKG